MIWSRTTFNVTMKPVDRSLRQSQWAQAESNTFIADLSRYQTMQDMGALERCLPPLLAHHTIMSGLLPDGEDCSLEDSLAVTQSEDGLKMKPDRPDIMMVGLRSDHDTCSCRSNFVTRYVDAKAMYHFAHCAVRNPIRGLSVSGRLSAPLSVRSGDRIGRVHLPQEDGNLWGHGTRLCGR